MEPGGHVLQVQQLHAHTWVEVHLDKAHIPEDAFDFDVVEPPAAWMVLDPTTNSELGGESDQRQGVIARLWQYIDYSRVLWANYVLGFNASRQETTLYGPLRMGWKASFESLALAESWQARWQSLGDSRLAAVCWHWYRRHWFDWRGGLLALAFCLASVGSFRAAHWLRRALVRYGIGGFGRGRDELPVLEMYRRLETRARQGGLPARSGSDGL